MKLTNSFSPLFLTALCCVTLSTKLLASTPSEQGYQIATLFDQRDANFTDSRADILMVLTNKKGQQTERQLQVQVLEDQEQGDKSLIKFNFPADIRGVSLLTHPLKVKSDEQWLYLPTVSRVKRISSRNKSGAFVGSEFSFEDMTNKDIDDYQYQYIKSENCTDSTSKVVLNCDVVERYPIDKDSGYSKQIVWFEEQDKKIFRIEYYDRKKSLLKVFTAQDFKRYAGKYWRPGFVEMSNVQTGKKTSLQYRDISFANGFTERDFHRSALRD